MTTIQNVSSTPDYISNFINSNLEQLNNIHDGGMDNFEEGCLGLRCSEEENTMDVFFMNRDLLIKNMSEESWEQLKISLKERQKKLFLVNDLDRNAIFLVYI
jgi:hypothetical protein